MLLVVALLFAGCAPRESPPQLDFTPGPAYVITEDEVRTAAYTVTTPREWRVIAGPAEDPYTFQLVAPEDRALIALSVRPLDPPPTMQDVALDDLVTRTAQTAGPLGTVYAVLVAAPGEIDGFAEVLAAVVASVR
ncbi:MAG: hypothetical protein IPM16_13800 [Chloroflexi bacterium]|nr:hypothetical protein [Chloroflexota bacterium]